MLKKFIGYISFVRGFSQVTIERCELTLHNFDLFLNTLWKTINKPQNITILDICDYLSQMREKWLSPASSNAILSCIKSFLRYIDEILELNVCKYWRIRGIRRQAPNIWYFDEQEKEKILKAINEWFGTKKITQIRNRLLTYMFLHTGLRVQEIANIRVNEIGETLQIIGKWGKRRFVYLREELLGMIKEYLEIRNKKSDYLFPAPKEWHIEVWTIKNVYKKLSKKLGFHIHPHKFRHTFAVDLLHLPWSNIYNVSRLMGHTWITTTQMYLGVNNTELKDLQFWLKF